MSQSRLKAIREDMFPKGYNDTLPPEYLPKGRLSDLKNGKVDDEKIQTRSGYTLVANDTGNKAILGLHGITLSDGTKRLYKFCDNSGGTDIEIWQYTGSGNWSSIDATLFTTNGNDVNCVSAEDKVIAFNGAEAPVIITPGSPSTAAAAGDVNFPKGKYGVWFHNFLFVAGVTSNPSRLYWSDLGDSDDFTNGVTGSVDINPDDGDTIVGLATFKDELVIFKRNRIWSLTGFGTSSFTVANMNERLTGYGTVSHRSIVNIGNDLLYLSHVGGDPEIRSLQRTRYGTIVEGGIISQDISGTNSMGGLANASLDKTAGCFDGRYAYFAVPLSGSAYNNGVFVYDTVEKGWARWTGVNASVWTEFNFSSSSKIYFGEASANSLVYSLEGTSDNGTAIDFQAITRRYGGDMPERKKKWKYCYVVADEASSDYSMTIDHSPDGYTYETLSSLSLNPQGTQFPITLDSDKLGATDVVRDRLPFSKSTSYYTQLKFYHNVADEPVAIRHWEIMYYPRALRDA